jgi:hypothetical protein
VTFDDKVPSERLIILPVAAFHLVNIVDFMMAMPLTKAP